MPALIHSLMHSWPLRPTSASGVEAAGWLSGDIAAAGTSRADTSRSGKRDEFQTRSPVLISLPLVSLIAQVEPKRTCSSIQF